MVPAGSGARHLARRVRTRGAGQRRRAGPARRLLSWARRAGFTDIAPTAAAWCFATPETRAWWSGLWADRTTDSVYADLAVAGGHATTEQLTAIADAWRSWGTEEDGWFMVPHGEVLCRA